MLKTAEAAWTSQYADVRAPVELPGDVGKIETLRERHAGGYLIAFRIWKSTGSH